MRKVKLDLDQLVVAGFETQQSPASAEESVLSDILCTFGCTALLDCLSLVPEWC
ncbi:hypothetical protein [Longimicrobium sp.]|uniref:hypothetical protein n=1 Tax=Longimicrobium sp. TaxID=2029185 RepID=UPI002E31C5B3|nr:hypothetical protein [Longimicrobium sp.]HEX6038679.1 hypothetical protein [Longimicrobium sp.]